MVLDRTVFYAASGEQPGDSGHLQCGNGSALAVTTATHTDGDKTRIVHIAADGKPLPAIGEVATARLDWEQRYRLMRMHSALHLLSITFAFPITGRSIGTQKGRLDFAMPEIPEDLAALESSLNAIP